MPRLVDYFVVCGLKEECLEPDKFGGYSELEPPLSRAYTAQVICHFPGILPGNPLDCSAVKTLCMPEGLQLKKNLEACEPVFHPFVITRENGSRLFGSVLTFYEPTHSTAILDQLDSLQGEYQARRRDGFASESAFYFNRATDTLFVSKSLCLVTSSQYVRPCRAYLEQLYTVVMEEEKVELPLENYIANLLLEVPAPRPGQCIQFRGPLGKISCCSPGEEELPLCDFSFQEFFETLSVKNVLKMLTCVLLEQQILLKSADLYRLMLCTECTMALLFPFSWPHVFVPILPTSQRGFLDAPVPFIMGLRIGPDSHIGQDLDTLNEASLCCIDVDNGVVESPEELPSLPDQERLMCQLAEVLLEHNVLGPDLPELKRQLSPLYEPPLDKKRPSIIDILAHIQKKPASHPMDSPIVQEIKQIIHRSSDKGGGDINTITDGVSSTNGPLSGAHEVDSEGAVQTEQEDGIWDYLLDNKEAAFTSTIRTTFLNYFSERFTSYEHFVIQPQQSYDQWLRNREQFQNFDKTAFLSDQSPQHWPFYSAFLETSMFSAFIDKKIISVCEPSHTDACLPIFDTSIENFLNTNGIPVGPTPPQTPSSSVSLDQGELSMIVEKAPLPRLLQEVGENSGLVDNLTASSRPKGIFPPLNFSSFQNCVEVEEEETSSGFSGDRLNSRYSDRPTSGRRRHGMGTAFSAHSHSKFVMQLWKESRLRVKHMLGSSPDAQSNIEENTHIANLCDLLERIWGHGLWKRESKSPLWSHLMEFGRLLCQDESPATSLSPPPPSYPSRSLSSFSPSLANMSSAHSMTSLVEASGRYSPSPQQRSRFLGRHKFQSPELRAAIDATLNPPPSSFLDDLQIINNMREIKTDVGHTRAWVRLALEKKTLSMHLTKLLSNRELCSQRYRNYAFLLTEDEREQFLLHLLSLSASDFSCFTLGFTDAMMTYRVLLVAEGKRFGLSSAVMYVNIAGENGRSGIREIHRGDYQMQFTCNNLGPLVSLRLGHDSAGLGRSVFVEMVLVHCITTGQTYRFNCGKWFARSEDDGSLERFLIGERVPRTLKGHSSVSSLDIESVLPTRKRTIHRDREEQPMLSDIKSSLNRCVEKLRTVLDASNRTTMLQRQQLLPLLYGPSGLAKCMELAFLLGYRNSKKSQKRAFVWDLMDLTLEHFNSSVGGSIVEEEDMGIRSARNASGTTLLSFVNTVLRINNLSGIGKDEKATLFFLIGLRDHHLPGWTQLLANASPASYLYEPTSFLRDPELLRYLLDILSMTLTLNVSLEPLLVRDL